MKFPTNKEHDVIPASTELEASPRLRGSTAARS